MATKAPPPGKRKKRKRKMRLKLKSSKISKTDSYSDSMGWSTNVGRTLGDKTDTKVEKIKHQCSMCGSIMSVKKPKKHRYTITCPHCEHEEQFNLYD
jgi:predicted RNA-binding Zn-ribbon protein involved in translation (DUF1610 family)